MKKTFSSLAVCFLCFGSMARASDLGRSDFVLHCGSFYDALTGAVDTSLESTDIAIIGDEDHVALQKGALGSGRHFVELSLTSESEHADSFVQHYVSEGRYAVDIRFMHGVPEIAQVQDAREIASCRP